jgi:hypothetical protein
MGLSGKPEMTEVFAAETIIRRPVDTVWARG